MTDVASCPAFQLAFLDFTLPGFRLSIRHVLFSAAEGWTDEHSCPGNEMIVVTSSSRRQPEQGVDTWSSYSLV